MFSSIINYFATNQGQEGQKEGQGSEVGEHLEQPELIIEQNGPESETLASITNDAIQSVITSDS